MLLGGYADPRTGQPVLDLEGAREMIDSWNLQRDRPRLAPTATAEEPRPAPTSRARPSPA